MSCKSGTDGLEKGEKVSVIGKQSVDTEAGGHVYGYYPGVGILVGCRG